MRRALAAQRRRVRGDDGYTLAELIVAMGIFSLLMSITFAVLIQITYLSSETVARTQSIRQAQLGISQIDRQVRSGNVILNPASETTDTSGVDPFFSMRIFTQENGLPMCAQWRVIAEDDDEFGDLQFRTWPPGSPEAVSDWNVVARNLIAMDVSPESAADIDPDDSSTWPPFWVPEADGVADTKAQSVRVTLRLKDPGERDSGKPTSVTSVITGRNTIFGYPTTSCTNVPDPEA